ncbi:hypothetical protein [Agrococcus citreus]|uniref:Uncharacterized protein n=1 Tax=Agrococcus citreus TaxID=84643 RepID=A0ABN1YTS8_9MICO
MQRNQWIIAGTAGVLGMGALAIGAVSLASAMTVQDASGRPIAGVEVRGEAAGDPVGDAPGSTLGKAIDLGGIVAPSPTDAPTEVPAPAPAEVEQPAPAPVAPAGSVSAHSAGSAG